MNNSANSALHTFMSYPFVQWAIQHWLLLLIIVIISLILIFFVIIPLLVRLFRKGKKSVETSELKKDLMIWKNLSQLVQGGDSTQNVKKNLSAQLKTIRLLLEQGIALIKKKSKRKYEVPWFAILGEPQSGKSTLLKNSGIDLICASGHNENFAQQIPLTCWLGTHAFFLDVSGKIFFDRWIESSGAEWDYLVKLVNKLHGKCPLSGIVLAIPADALLADDEILTKQKAQLIGAEMYQLLHTVGMNLPCHVVVTKMDMLLGFREYFSTLSEENKSSVFGWYNPDEKGEFSQAVFDEYWTNAEDHLREGIYPLVLNPVFYNGNNNNSTSRFSISSQIYLFPESFAKLKKNLNTYLNSIFGPDAWNGRDQIFMTGVFFSSAEDNGIVLSDTFANLQGKKQEEAPLRSQPARSNVSLFVRQFLTEVVIPSKVLASFTAGKLLKKQIPAFILGFLILFLGIFWMSRALIENHEIQDKFNADVKYYQNLGNLLESNEITNSPLIGTDEKGNPVLFNEIPMKSMPNISRMQFFYNTYSTTSKDFYAPWGYKISSFLYFGWPLNMGYKYRQTIFNLIQSEMVFIPTARTVQSKILAKEQEPFSITKRDAIEDFSDIMLNQGNESSSFTPINDLLMYLFPDIHIDTLRLFSTYNGKYQKGNDGVKARIIYDYDYAKAQKTGYKQFFNAWDSLNIYEELDYPIVRSGYRCLTALGKNQELLRQKIDNLSRNPMESENDLISIQKELKEQIRLVQEGKKITRRMSGKKLSFLENSSEKSSVANVDKDKDNLSTPADSLSILDKSYAKYKDILKSDHQYILKYIKRLSEVVKRRSDFFQIKEDSANLYFKEIERKLQAEFDLLKQQEQYIIKSRLFHIAKTKEQDKKEIEFVSDEKLCVGEVLEQLIQVVMQLPPAEKLKSVSDFQARWDDLLAKSADALEDFDAIAQKYAEDPDIAINAKALRKYLVHQIAYNKFILATNLVDSFPLKHSDWNLWISKFDKNNENVFKIPDTIANESIGSLSIPIHAKPDVLLPLMTPFSTVKRFAVPAKEAEPEATADTKAPPSTIKIKNFEQAEQCLQQGLADYIDFWGTYPDSISLKCETWSEFRTACAKLKPYEVNTLLLIVYKTAINVLQQIPDNLLREDLKKTRNAYIEAMNGKVQLITPHFSEICSRQTSAWSLLSDSPEEAYKEFISYNQKKLLSEYLAVIATGNKGDIPWWSLFFKQGIELLKKSAIKSLAESIAKDENNFFRFPICADAVSKEVFSEEDIAKLAKTLSIMGFSSTNAEKDTLGSAPKDAKDKANVSSAEDFISDAKKLDLTSAMDPQSKKCGEIIYLVADALGTRNKLLVWTLSIPEIEKQKLLSANSGNLPLAQYRYRFLEVYSNGLSKTKRVPLSEKALAELARGDVYEKDIELRLYAYSNSEEPTAIVKFDGEWSILRMYLQPNSYFDPECKTLYAPIEIKDSADAKTVLHLGIKFNKVLPPPAEWPSSQNWPTFSRVQRKAQPSNVSQEQLWNLLLNAPDPASREQLLVRHVVNGPYPEIEVSVDNDVQIQQTTTGVSYRYVELSVPGQPSKRINLEKGVVLGSIPLLVPGFSIKFYRFSDEKVPDSELKVSGPYALLNLLSEKDAKVTGNDLQVCIGNQKVLLPLKIKLKKTK